MQIFWEKWCESAGMFRSQIGNVTLVVTPDTYAKGLSLRPKRGTKWHAQCSQFDGKSTIMRYGRDEYGNLQDTKEDAMRLAEDIFNEEWNKRRQ